MFCTDVIKVDRMLHMLRWIYMYIASACPSCFIYFFICMLQVWMLHMFHTYIASVLSGCCIYLQ
jgi:hypothetical protein